MTEQPPAGRAAGAGVDVPSSEFGTPTVSGTRREGRSSAAEAFLAATGSQTTGAPGGAQPTATTGKVAKVTKGPNAAKAAGARGPRRARLQVRHINPWTVLKFSCVLSIALFFVWLIVVGVLYGVLDATSVIGKINDTVTTINGPGSTEPVTPGIVFGGAAIIGAVNIVLFIALSTVGSVIYNLCADLVGGVEVTLSER